MRVHISLKTILFLAFFGVKVAVSQSAVEVSLSPMNLVRTSQDYLADSLKAGLSLYNGIDHPGYLRSIKGTAYLDSEEFAKGQVKYDGVWYTIPMLYDLYSENLILTHFNKYNRISLINEKVDQFILHGHLFRNFLVTGSQQMAPKGLCEVIYEGDSISIYAKKRKLLNERSTIQGLERDFSSYNQYYMMVNGSYHIVKSKGDMFALMGSKKREVVAELRKKKIKFRKNTEEALITASKIYEKI